MKVLLTGRADLEARASCQHEQCAPLALAAQGGSEEVVRALLAAGADARARDDPQYTPPCVHFAAGMGHEAVVETLLAAGADKEGRENQQCTPLHFAAQGGHVAVVQALVAAGADKEARMSLQQFTLQLGGCWDCCTDSNKLGQGCSSTCSKQWPPESCSDCKTSS
mmetsp:Transcript_13418/g.20417  ORF Transcript_13418/g.20417 Transcript_13418/m.20417 type:complete len:166 (-) Transcript_13418:50-547(-)